MASRSSASAARTKVNAVTFVTSARASESQRHPRHPSGLLRRPSACDLPLRPRLCQFLTVRHRRGSPKVSLLARRERLEEVITLVGQSVPVPLSYCCILPLSRGRSWLNLPLPRLSK